jgi:uncharacterized coiled-coil protein SlyX
LEKINPQKERGGKMSVNEDDKKMSFLVEQLAQRDQIIREQDKQLHAQALEIFRLEVQIRELTESINGQCQ